LLSNGSDFLLTFGRGRPIVEEWNSQNVIFRRNGVFESGFVFNFDEIVVVRIGTEKTVILKGWKFFFRKTCP
jgi:hypothetical protein